MSLRHADKRPELQQKSDYQKTVKILSPKMVTSLSPVAAATFSETKAKLSEVDKDQSGPVSLKATLLS